MANKETLVTAGNIVMNEAQKYGVDIIPVDSEHSAIYQCLKNENHRAIERLIITASGGAFRGKTLDELKYVKKEDALKHPNWSRGNKITIDSATLVNKGLEVIEAAHLFNLSKEKIEVVVHKESIIHSMVEFVDGAIIAQLGTSSMKVPIQYALYEGKRKNLDVERLDFKKLKSLNFEEPNLEVFRGLALSLKALEIGGTMPAVLNAANEVAVSKFLNDEIAFLKITEIIEDAMNNHKIIENPSLSDIYNTIDWVIERYK